MISFAKEVPIRLFIHEEWTSDKRSAIIYPSASIVYHTIIISSDEPVYNIRVTIKDELGLIIHSTEVTVASQVCIPIPISIEKGNYILEINNEELCLIGEFSLE